MPKTVEQIKAEVTALVKSQGNQGAISLGTVLDDITELAGEGGGSTTSPMLISVYQDDDRVWHIASPSLETIQSYAVSALEGSYVAVKVGDNYSAYRISPVCAYHESGVTTLQWSKTFILSDFVEVDEFSLDTSTGEITALYKKYPAD